MEIACTYIEIACTYIEIACTYIETYSSEQDEAVSQLKAVIHVSKLTFERRHEKNNVLHMRKQRHRSASR